MEQRRGTTLPLGGGGKGRFRFGPLGLHCSGTWAGCLFTGGRGWRSRFPTRPLLIGVGGPAILFPVVFFWRRVFVVKKVSVLLCYFLVFWQKREKVFLVCAHWHLCAWGFPSPSPGYAGGKRKTQGAHCHVAGVLRSLPRPLSLHLSVFLYNIMSLFCNIMYRVFSCI